MDASVLKKVDVMVETDGHLVAFVCQCCGERHWWDHVHVPHRLVTRLNCLLGDDVVVLQTSVAGVTGPSKEHTNHSSSSGSSGWPSLGWADTHVTRTTSWVPGPLIRRRILRSASSASVALIRERDTTM